MPYRPIRFCLPTTKLRVNNYATHALVGYLYLEALLSFKDLLVRPLPYQGMPYGFLDTDPDWSKLASAFYNPAPLGDDFINVVCGFGSIFTPSVTQGVYNIAITVSWPRLPKGGEIDTLHAYDWVCCPQSKDVKAFKEIGVEAKFLPLPMKDTESYVMARDLLYAFVTEGYKTKEKSWK